MPLNTDIDITDFSDEKLLKGFKGIACDPDEAIMVDVYNRSTGKFRQQLFKRRNLLKRSVTYLGVDGGRHLGVILAFRVDNGNPVVGYREDLSPPKEKNQIILVE